MCATAPELMAMAALIVLVVIADVLGGILGDNE